MDNPIIEHKNTKYIYFILGLLLILLLGYWVRYYRLEEKELSHREGYWLALSQSNDNQTSHSIYPIILNKWIQIDGWFKEKYLSESISSASPDIFWARYLSLLFGLLGILIFYQLGKIIDKHELGIWLALFWSISPGAVELSREINPISLQIFFNILCLFSYLKIRKTRTIYFNYFYIWSSLFFISGYIGFLIHFSTLFILILLLIHQIFDRVIGKIHPTIFKQILMLQILLWILLYIRLFYLKFPIFSNPVESVITEPLNLKQSLFLFGYGSLSTIHRGWRFDFPDILIFTANILLFGSILIGFYYICRKRAFENIFYPIFYLFGLVFLFYLGSRVTGFMGFIDWYIYILPFFYLILIMLWNSYPIPNPDKSRAGWKYRFLGFYLIIIISCLLAHYQKEQTISWKKSAYWLNERIAPDDKILFLPNDYSYAFDYYFRYPQMRMRIRQIDDLLSLFEENEKPISRIWLVKYSMGNRLPSDAGLIRPLNSFYSNQYIEYINFNPGILSITRYEIHQNEL